MEHAIPTLVLCRPHQQAHAAPRASLGLGSLGREPSGRSRADLGLGSFGREQWHRERRARTAAAAGPSAAAAAAAALIVSRCGLGGSTDHRGQ